MKALWKGNPHAGKTQTRSPRRFNRVVVVHTTENKLGTTALSVAHWQNRQTDKFSGYHYLIDAEGHHLFGDPKTFRAYHAGTSAIWNKDVPTLNGPGNNHIGISMVCEAENFTDPEVKNDSRLHNIQAKCSVLMAQLAEEYSIPLNRITVQQYEAGKQGFLGHMDVALPEGRKSDPGRDFPWSSVLIDARSILSNKHAEAMTDKGKVLAVDTTGAGLEYKEPFSKDDLLFLQDFAKACRVQKVQPSSLAYVTKTIRELRTQLGLDDQTDPEDLINYLLDGTEYKNIVKKDYTHIKKEH